MYFGARINRLHSHCVLAGRCCEKSSSVITVSALSLFLLLIAHSTSRQLSANSLYTYTTVQKYGVSKMYVLIHTFIQQGHIKLTARALKGQ